jgi:uncharacterized C2H2 Zn-finger protein
MRRQFKYRHLTDTIIILEEGELPRCPRCGMFGNFRKGHDQTKTCKEGTLTDLRDMRREQTKARTKRFQIGEEEIGAVQKFKYLGQITSGGDDDDDDDLQPVRDNLRDGPE